MLTPSPAQRIKAATRDLVVAAGGLVRAGELCGYSKTHMHRFCDANGIDIIPLLAAVTLEQDTGRQDVSRAMAAMSQRACGAGVQTSFAEKFSAVATASGVLISKTTEAMVDGHITPNEQREICGFASDQIVRLTEFESALGCETAIAAFNPKTEGK